VDDLASAPATCWGLAVALLAIASTPLAGPRDLAAPTPAQFGAKLAVYIVIAVLVLLPVAFGPVNRVKAAFSGPLARWLGAISYGIFLWHPLVIDAIFLTKGRWIFTGSPLSTFIATLAGGLLLASICYYGVEQPLQRLALRWPRRRAGSSVESHSVQPAAMTAS
jgi:peptidoglycan/LPS O-acetylase OafA/YrhL